VKYSPKWQEEQGIGVLFCPRRNNQSHSFFEEADTAARARQQSHQEKVLVNVGQNV
jgi:hypothetical protein